MNYKIIRRILALVLRIAGLSMALPLICSLIYRETQMISIWLISIVVCIGASLLFSVKQPKDKTFFAREGAVSVALSWIILSIFGAIPFFISGYIPSFVDAVF